MRNPNWTKDETILALDLYFRVGQKMPGENHPEVIALSKLLNELDIIPKTIRTESFRNPEGVSMKVGNIQYHDNTTTSGLPAGSQIDEWVWNEFGSKPEEVRKLAEIIKTKYQTLKPENISSEDEDESFPEGRIIEKLHKRLERSGSAPKKKKDSVLKQKGTLSCDVCGFDFGLVYGPLGKGFAECHHITPLSSLGAITRTKLSDLAIVCSNCHRMLHRKRPWLSPEELSALIPIRYKFSQQ